MKYLYLNFVTIVSFGINLFMIFAYVGKYVGLLDIFVVCGIIITAIIGDYLLQKIVGNLLRAVADCTTHGLIGTLSWSIVTLHIKNRYSKYEIIFCGIIASLIDLDHFIKARSLQLRVS